jgi:hypothetical protein
MGEAWSLMKAIFVFIIKAGYWVKELLPQAKPRCYSVFSYTTTSRIEPNLPLCLNSEEALSGGVRHSSGSLKNLHRGA